MTSARTERGADGPALVDVGTVAERLGVPIVADARTAPETDDADKLWV